MAERPLWAPWRIDYVTAPKDGECIFCAAASAKDEPEREGTGLVLLRRARCFAMLNAFPYASGHVMVCPNRHIGRFDELEIDELQELTLLVRDSIRALGGLMQPAGFNVGLNLGEAAGAGFAEHIHWHIVPRWHGDTNFMPVIGQTPVIPQALDATAAALRAAFTQLAG